MLADRRLAPVCLHALSINDPAMPWCAAIRSAIRSRSAIGATSRGFLFYNHGFSVGTPVAETSELFLVTSVRS